MQGTRFQSLVWEDSAYWEAAKPMHHNYRSLCLQPYVPQQEKPPIAEAHALQRGSLLDATESPHAGKDPAQPKKQQQKKRSL